MHSDTFNGSSLYNPFSSRVPDISLHYIIHLLKCFSVRLENLLTSPQVQILYRLNVSFSMNITGWAQTQTSSLQELYCVSSYSIYYRVSYFLLIDTHASLPLIHYNFLKYRRHAWTMKQKWWSATPFFLSDNGTGFLEQK